VIDLIFTPLNLDVLSTESDMDIEDIESILRIYVHEFERDLNKLSKALELNNMKQILDVTHKMRGDSSTIALTELEALIVDFEKNALTENFTLLHKQFSMLSSYHAFLATWIESLT